MWISGFTDIRLFGSNNWISEIDPNFKIFLIKSNNSSNKIIIIIPLHDKSI
ncbi:hypothetical protein Pint_31969 [Pistacia integerrima]|uniref:Uncharacterized protein n=1 Tax=Pistacia integerrima TaxID=434235 RepID=A0ACC0XRU7_9ROSI|nr:hypothetical protein Pint_31969 [Pistacia integerrima]